MLREILCGLIVVMVAEPDGAVEARRLWQNGRYAEALEAYDELLKAPGGLSAAARARLVLGRADALASQGESDKAIEGVRDLARDQPDNPDLAARLADLLFGRGDWDGAEASVRQALKADPDHLAARWVEARLLEARGESRRGRRRPGSGSSSATTPATTRSSRTPTPS